MGRKIPGKKHRTVKDPYKQQQKRLESIRLKVNNPPSNADEQEIPKSLLKIMEYKNRTKNIVVNKNKPKKKKKKKGPVSLSVAKLIGKEPLPKGLTKPDAFIPNLIQKPNESPVHFLGRLHSLTQKMINEVEFEKKFGVEIKRNEKTGEVIEVKNAKKNIRSKKKKLSEKRKDKVQLKKESLANIKDFSQFKDKVEFGEIVHRPPDLSNIKKIDKTTEKNRYKSLLLNQSIKAAKTSTNDILERERLENDRKFIVEAYRQYKKRL